MSDGHYCFVRDLGPVKGGKGMKHHEVIVDFNLRGVVMLFKRLVKRRPKTELASRVEPEGVAVRSSL